MAGNRYNRSKKSTKKRALHLPEALLVVIMILFGFFAMGAAAIMIWLANNIQAS